MFYYKSLTNNYITKSEEESIVGMTQITENEYNQLKLANKQRIAKKVRINELKKLLSQSDYKAIKYAEGLISAQVYMLDNNSYELSFIQRANIQIAHDKDTTEELKEYCRNRINYYRGIL